MDKCTLHSASLVSLSFPLKMQKFCRLLCLDCLFFCSLDDCGLAGCGHFGASSLPYSHTKLFLFLLHYQEVMLHHWPDIFFLVFNQREVSIPENHRFGNTHQRFQAIRSKFPGKQVRIGIVGFPELVNKLRRNL